MTVTLPITAAGRGHMRNVVAISSALLVAATLLAAAVLKARSMADFASITSTLVWVPANLRRYLPVAVPITEIITAALIFASVTHRAGVYSALALLTFFTLFLGWNAVYGTAPCQCFGSMSAVDNARDAARVGILRNGLLMGLCFTAICLGGRSKTSSDATETV